jgi:hypothetical protein
MSKKLDKLKMKHEKMKNETFSWLEWDEVVFEYTLNGYKSAKKLIGKQYVLEGLGNAERSKDVDCCNTRWRFNWN